MEHKISKSLTKAGLTQAFLLELLENPESTNCKDEKSSLPTYGILIGLLHFADSHSAKLKINSKILLKQLMDKLYPNCTINRADRLYRRIKGFQEMDKIEDILEVTWRPQPSGHHSNNDQQASEEMIKHGLNSETLKYILHNPYHVTWMMSVCPTIQFYIDLHNILKKNRITSETIGLIYRSIDCEIKQNLESNAQAYNYVVAVLKQDCSQNQKIHHRGSRIVKMEEQSKKLKHANERQHKEIETLQNALEETRKIVNEKNKEINTLKKTVKELQDENDRLMDELEECKNEIKADYESKYKMQENKQPQASTLSTFSCQAYTNNVRQLYYSLLALRLPVRQIRAVVENVIKYLFPDVDISNLRLPSKSCASYMRKQEIPTINKIHKATELAKSEQWHLNSDGTTLNQKKKCAFLVNGVVVGIQDVANGSSEVALDALKHLLSKLQGVSSCDGLSISRIISSTSDGASTQMKFNTLLEEETGKPVIINKCCMHLGVNLRSAQVKAVMADLNVPKDDLEKQKQCYDGIDKMVHEVAKLFGHLGTPEYCYGADTFQTFLIIKVRECFGAEKQYYECVQSVSLKRQVGSRYYVTSYNAGCIFFLRTAMVAFLREQKLIKSFNLLESSCFEKLQNSVLLANLRLEGLLFDKVYSDLMMLVKSKVLNKTALDMNLHLKELLEFLETIKDEPRLLLNSEWQVFKSEPRLYSQSCPKTNHRLKKKYIPVRKCLYDNNENEFIILPMISVAASAMSLKLQSYKQDHLPGGQYYDPDFEVSSVLNALQSHNDQTESVFGCNDWINRVLPNMAQSTRSAIIEASMNKTLKWLQSQNEDKKIEIIKTARSQRKNIMKEMDSENELLLEKKITERQNIIKKAMEKQKKYYKEIQELKCDPLITSTDALNQHIMNINSLSIPQSVKDAEIKAFVKRQIKLRVEVFQQKKAKITFTEKGKPKSSSQLLQELSDVITTFSVSVCRVDETDRQVKQLLHVVFDKPSLLVGVKIKHQFQDIDGRLQWYDGVIRGYKKPLFTIYYASTDEVCLFSVDEIEEDFTSGDLWIQ